MSNQGRGLQFGDFILNVSERLLLRDGRPVPLTPKAFDLLAALAARPGRLVTKDELLREVWRDSFVEESNLAYHVFALRRALGEAADGEQYIETIPKHGYRLVGPVQAVDGIHHDSGGGSDAGAPLLENRGQQLGSDPAAAERSSEDQPGQESPQDAVPGIGSGSAAKKERRRFRLFSRGVALSFLGGACVATVGLWLVYPRPLPAARDPIRVEVSTEVRLTESSAFAISPDGHRLVFAGAAGDGVVRLWLRSLDASEARPLPGTEVALGSLVPPMFWSPDSRFVAFDAAGQLKKVDVTGGDPQTVCALPSLAIGGSWNQDGVIVVGSPQGGIFRCPASGGEASVVTQPDTARQQSAHVFPWFLPDGRRFLYLSVSRTAPESSGLFIHTLGSPAKTDSPRILATGFGPAYVPGREGAEGHLLFMRDGALFAQVFDPARLQLSGQAERIAGPVGSFLDGGFFSASSNGALAFRPLNPVLSPKWLDRLGNVLQRVGEPARYVGLSLAPDSARAVMVQSAVRATADQDLAPGSAVRPLVAAHLRSQIGGTAGVVPRWPAHLLHQWGRDRLALRAVHHRRTGNPPVARESRTQDPNQCLSRRPVPALHQRDHWIDSSGPVGIATGRRSHTIPVDPSFVRSGAGAVLARRTVGGIRVERIRPSGSAGPPVCAGVCKRPREGRGERGGGEPTARNSFSSPPKARSLQRR